MVLQQNTLDLRLYYENLHNEYVLAVLGSFTFKVFFVPYRIFIHFLYTKMGNVHFCLDSDRRPIKLIVKKEEIFQKRSYYFIRI